MQLPHVVAKSEHSTCHNPNAPCTTVDNMAVMSKFHIHFLRCKMAGKCTQWFFFVSFRVQFEPLGTHCHWACLLWSNLTKV